jgi:hypothetical protein
VGGQAASQANVLGSVESIRNGGLMDVNASRFEDNDVNGVVRRSLQLLVGGPHRVADAILVYPGDVALVRLAESPHSGRPPEADSHDLIEAVPQPV